MDESGFVDANAIDPPLELVDEVVEQEVEDGHPLNHHIWRCKGYEGGIRAHLALSWAVRAKPKLDGARGRLADRIRPDGT